MYMVEGGIALNHCVIWETQDADTSLWTLTMPRRKGPFFHVGLLASHLLSIAAQQMYHEAVAT